MAFDALITTARPGAPLSLMDLRGLFKFADAARSIVRTDDADQELDELCDAILGRLTLAPVSDWRDAVVKVWLLDVAGERGWDYEYCSRHVIGQLAAYLSRSWSRSPMMQGT